MIKEIIEKMTLDEKISMYTGSEDLKTTPLPKFNIEKKSMSDGPHGIWDLTPGSNCTLFSCLSSLASSWDRDMARKMGNAIAYDCIEHNIDMILAPGINIKRFPLCGRNFEYLSEDPYLAGMLGAAYINGVEEKGVKSCLKHYAVNNQEEYRTVTSVEIDERTLREIYLKAYEVAIKNSKPQSVMCAYNKINGIWASENPFLYKVLKDEWGFEGYTVSDWGAVHDAARSLAAGLDLEMPPQGERTAIQLKKGLEEGIITEEDLDKALLRTLQFCTAKKAEKIPYDRDSQHALAREIAASGVVLLKNDDETLPITKEKYKKVTLVGEYAVSPLISGQGSTEVLCDEEYIDSPLEELKKALPGVEFDYIEMYKKAEFSPTMLWPKDYDFRMAIKDSDLVVFFAGSMESEDTENFDRASARINPNQEFFINAALNGGKKVAVILQSGGALIFANWCDKVSAIAEMWLGGEAAGGAIADVLSGKVNPSGKLAETFPKTLRTDLEYPGDGLKVEYKEKLEVGYRYYDKHPDEIKYPFGFGLSYTKFDYSNLEIKKEEEKVKLSFDISNVGDFDGAEVYQIYVRDVLTTVVKPEKELKEFGKVFLKKGECKKVSVEIPFCDLSYYNIMIDEWVVENGEYEFLVGASSTNIRLKASLDIQEDMGFTMGPGGTAKVGGR